MKAANGDTFNEVNFFEQVQRAINLAIILGDWDFTSQLVKAGSWDKSMAVDYLFTKSIWHINPEHQTLLTQRLFDEIREQFEG